MSLCPGRRGRASSLAGGGCDDPGPGAAAPGAGACAGSAACGPAGACPQPEKKSRRSQESAAREVEQHAQEVSQAIEEELAEPEEAYQYPPVTLLDQNSDDNYTEVGAELRNNSRRLAQTITSFGVDAKPGTWSTDPASPGMSSPWTRG